MNEMLTKLARMRREFDAATFRLTTPKRAAEKACAMTSEVEVLKEL